MAKADSKKKISSQLVDIDRVIHEPARYLILAYLFVVDAMDFLSLMRQTELTQGNLSSHIRKLENAGYVEIQKDFIGRRPRTMLNISSKGRKAFMGYRERMKRAMEELPE